MGFIVISDGQFQLIHLETNMSENFCQTQSFAIMFKEGMDLMLEPSHLELDPLGYFYLNEEYLNKVEYSKE